MLVIAPASPPTTQVNRPSQSAAALGKEVIMSAEWIQKSFEKVEELPGEVGPFTIIGAFAGGAVAGLYAAAATATVAPHAAHFGGAAGASGGVLAGGTVGKALDNLLYKIFE